MLMDIYIHCGVLCNFTIQLNKLASLEVGLVQNLADQHNDTSKAKILPGVGLDATSHPLLTLREPGPKILFS